jgi:hypothetical protein
MPSYPHYIIEEKTVTEKDIETVLQKMSEWLVGKGYLAMAKEYVEREVEKEWWEHDDGGNWREICRYMDGDEDEMKEEMKERRARKAEEMEKRAELPKDYIEEVMKTKSMKTEVWKHKEGVWWGSMTVYRAYIVGDPMGKFREW